MTPTPEVQERLRRYLLGQLIDNAREEIEKELLANDELFEELLVVEDEIIDDYLSGKLDEGERAAFEQNFLATPERHDKLRFGRAFNRYLSSQAAAVPTRQVPASRGAWAWTQTLVSSPVGIAAFAIILVGIAFGVWRVFFHQSEVDKGLVALNAAYREQRPLEARISSLSYAPFSQTRGANEPEHVDSLARDRAELTLNTAVGERQGDAAAHHALGEVYLAKKDFDRAIHEFDVALANDAKNAKLYSDLGAAWLEKGKLDVERGKADPASLLSGKSMEELGRSLQNLTKALELNPSLLEALFNRALCEDHLTLYPQAENDWREYLKKDPSSPWAAEVQEKLEMLRRNNRNTRSDPDKTLQEFLAAYRARNNTSALQLMSESNSTAGNDVANRLLESYANGVVTGTTETLDAYSYLGSLNQQRSGDSYHSDVANFYRSLSPNTLPALAKAHKHISEGYQRFIKSDSLGALTLFNNAKQEFLSKGDVPEAIFTEYLIGHVHVLASDMKSAEEVFSRLLPKCEEHHYQWLIAQSLFDLAHISFDRNQYSQALNLSTRASKLFESANDADGLVRDFIQRGDEYRALNNPIRSLELLLRGLEILTKSPSAPMQQWGLYTDVALDFDLLNLYFAARAFRVHALNLALEMDRPLIISRSYSYLGNTCAKMGAYQEAIANLRKAFAIGQGLSGQRAGKEMMANASLWLGDAYRLSGNHTEALKEYDQSLSLYSGLNFDPHAYAAHSGKLFDYIALHDDAAGENELQTSLRLSDEFRSKITGEGQRNTFFETEQTVYDAAVDFAFSRINSSRKAFDYSEQSRARSLYDAISQGALVIKNENGLELNLPSAVSSPVPIDDLQPRIPNGTQILEYTVTDKTVFIWVFTSQSSWSEKTEIDQQALIERVEKYLSSLTGGAETTPAALQQQASELYRILIKPIEGALQPGALVCIIPDRILNYLPFSALLSASGRYLIQDYAIQMSPSANIFLSSTGAKRNENRVAQERILAVGDPSFDPTAFPALSRLPSASREASEISQLYPRHSLLMEENARERSVKDEMTRADVVHIAAHYEVDRRSEMLSRLVLAREPERQAGSGGIDGVLQAYEVYQTRLPQTRLVVLSACQTGAERQYAGEGAMNIARPFLASGVPLVVASLWPVDSDATAQLMISFHRHRRNDGISTVEALRRAQTEMIDGADARYQAPYYWAAFQTIGRYAKF